MRALFFGTPEIAVPSLLGLGEVAEIVGVVCQPDRPAGRGLKQHEPAVKVRARELGLEVVQPEKVRTGELQSWVQNKRADVAVVIAYGRILPDSVLYAPRLGSVNLHASLLPRYRGAAPIQRAIMDGEAETGVCLMKMDAGMDTGPVLAVHRLSIGPEETAGQLAVRLGELAREVTLLEVPRYVRGELTESPQDESRATHAPPIERADCALDFTSHTARELANRARGLAPRPGAFTTITARADGAPATERPPTLRVLQARAIESAEGGAFPELEPGEVGVLGPRLFVGARGGSLLEILEAQLEGKRALPARDLLNGRALREGDRLG